MLYSEPCDDRSHSTPPWVLFQSVCQEVGLHSGRPECVSQPLPAGQTAVHPIQPFGQHLSFVVGGAVVGLNLPQGRFPHPQSQAQVEPLVEVYQSLQHVLQVFNTYHVMLRHAQCRVCMAKINGRKVCTCKVCHIIALYFTGQIFL